MNSVITPPPPKETKRGIIPDDFVSMKEIAFALGVSRQTVLNWSNRGLFPRYEIDGTVRFRWSEVERAVVRRVGKE